jgi:hypothetical protein
MGKGRGHSRARENEKGKVPRSHKKYFKRNKRPVVSDSKERLRKTQKRTWVILEQAASLQLQGKVRLQ